MQAIATARRLGGRGRQHVLQDWKCGVARLGEPWVVLQRGPAHQAKAGARCGCRGQVGEGRHGVSKKHDPESAGDHVVGTVLVERRYMHPVYKKYLKRTDKYAAHDEHNSAKEGDKVQIMECAPISKRKSWTLLVDGKEVTTKAAPKEAAPKKKSTGSRWSA